MTNIIPFRPRAKRPEAESNRPQAVAPERRRDVASDDWFAAAYDIHRQLARDFKFYVIVDGSPDDGKTLHDVTVRLRTALNALAAQFGAAALRNLGSIQVSFSREKNELGRKNGFPTLLLSNNFTEDDVAEALMPTLRARPQRSS